MKKTTTRKYKSKKRSLLAKPKYNRVVIGLFIAAFGAIGAYLLQMSQAATTAKGDVNTSTVEQRLLNDPNVLWLGTADSTGDWKIPFGMAGEHQPVNVSQMTPPTPWKGKALRIRHAGPGSPDAGDGRWGYDARNTFAKMGIAAQDEAYMRYYVWVPANLKRAGKMPGLQGHTGNIWGPAGGGSGTSPDGSTNWSARTMWKYVISDPNKIGMITYLYVPYANGAKKPADFSVSVRYKYDGTELLLNKVAWNYVEQRVKLNTVGQKNGIFEGWINGKKGVSLSDVEYRTNPDLHINQLNITTFWGGPPEDYPTELTDWYYDDFVISKAYIGARQADPVTPTNQSPVARITPSFTTTVDTVANIYSATSSDPDGDPLTFAWSLVSQPSGSNISLTQVAASHVKFTPVKAGAYVIKVTVTDNKGASASKETTVTVTSATTDQPKPDDPAKPQPEDTTTGSGGGGVSDPVTDPTPPPNGDKPLAVTTKKSGPVHVPANNTVSVSGDLGVANPDISNDDIVKVELLVDGKVIVVDTEAPFLPTIDTSTLSDGTHTIEIRTTKKDGSVETSARNIVVNNELNPIEKLRNFIFKPFAGKSGRTLNIAFVGGLGVPAIAAGGVFVYLRRPRFLRLF